MSCQGLSWWNLRTPDSAVTYADPRHEGNVMASVKHGWKCPKISKWTSTNNPFKQSEYLQNTCRIPPMWRTQRTPLAPSFVLPVQDSAHGMWVSRLGCESFFYGFNGATLRKIFGKAKLIASFIPGICIRTWKEGALSTRLIMTHLITHSFLFGVFQKQAVPNSSFSTRQMAFWWRFFGHTWETTFGAQENSKTSKSFEFSQENSDQVNSKIDVRYNKDMIALKHFNSNVIWSTETHLIYRLILCASAFKHTLGTALKTWGCLKCINLGAPNHAETLPSLAMS